MKTTNLRPINQKSFYGKAKMIKESNTTLLKSYNTIVAKYHHNTDEVEVLGWYSATTARHINTFLNHFGFGKMTKKEMEA